MAGDLRGNDISALDPVHATLAGALVTADQAVVVARALGLDVHVR